MQAANRGKSKFFSIPNEKVKVSDDLPFFRRKIEDIQNKIQEKNREIEKNSQMTKEYEELIKNLEFSIVILQITIFPSLNALEEKINTITRIKGIS